MSKKRHSKEVLDDYQRLMSSAKDDEEASDARGGRGRTPVDSGRRRTGRRQPASSCGNSYNNEKKKPSKMFQMIGPAHVMKELANEREPLNVEPAELIIFKDQPGFVYLTNTGCTRMSVRTLVNDDAVHLPKKPAAVLEVGQTDICLVSLSTSRDATENPLLLCFQYKTGKRSKSYQYRIVLRKAARDETREKLMGFTSRPEVDEVPGDGITTVDETTAVPRGEKASGAVAIGDTHAVKRYEFRAYDKPDSKLMKNGVDYNDL